VWLMVGSGVCKLEMKQKGDDEFCLPISSASLHATQPRGPCDVTVIASSRRFEKRDEHS